MRALSTLLMLASLAGAVSAQQPQEAPSPQEKPAATSIDATKLGISLKRIQKGLRAQPSTSSEGIALFHLDFQVLVYGQAPRIDVLKGYDLFNGAVPGTAPTHGQMIQFWTPPAYSAGALPISALAYWGAQQLWKKSKKTACEDEIANYRSLLMQGINVSAPRCTQ